MAALACSLLLTTSCSSAVVRGVPTLPSPHTVSADQQLAALVPDSVAADGVLDIGTDPSYRPMEYTTADGLLTGVDIQLAQAVAATLGLTPVFSFEAFTALESGVRAGRFELAAAALTVRPDTTLATDAVLYFDSGTRLARQQGSAVTLDDLCGTAISVLEGSVQLSDLEAESDRCRTAGRAGVRAVAGETVDEVVRALLVGDAEAMIGDSAVIQAGVRSYSLQLELDEQVVSPAPLGMLTMPDDDALADAVAAALDRLIRQGVYDEILLSGGLTEGAVAAAVVLPVGESFTTNPLEPRPPSAD